MKRIEATLAQRFAVALLGVIAALLASCAASPVAVRGELVSPAGRSTVYEIDIDDPRAAEEIDRLRAATADRGRPFCLWIDVGRNERLADEHPTWIAGIGSHGDWRRKFPDAPEPGPGRRIGVYPWTPIWYREVLENRRDAIYKVLKGRTGGIEAIFLAHVQGAPSACGCGNDQCRWTVDYDMRGGPQRVEGAPTALLVDGLKKDHPGVEWVPVWVTECEEVDFPGDGSTGYCGAVPCFKGRCWKDSTREMDALARTATGPIALVAAAGPFRRELPRYAPDGGWLGSVLKEVETIPPALGHDAWPASRLIPVVEGDAPAAATILDKGVKAVLVLATPLEEAWEPRIIPAVTSTAAPAPGEGAAHDSPGAHARD